MSGQRDHEKMKLMSCYVRKEYLEEAHREAERRGITLSALLRELMDDAIAKPIPQKQGK